MQSDLQPSEWYSYFENNYTNRVECRFEYADAKKSPK